MLSAAAAGIGNQQRADALAPGAPRAAASMLHRLDVVGQVGVNDDADIGQIDAARGDVGRDAYPRAPVPQRLHRLIAFVLAEFAREQNG